MKLIIVLFACLVSTLAFEFTQEQKARILEYTDNCVEQEGSTKEQAFTLLMGNFEDIDTKVKCFANCILELAGFVVDGQFKTDTMLEKLGIDAGVDNIRANLAKCDSIKAAEKCENGFQLFQCFYKNRVLID